ncbi:hypothetical protein [Klebsiella pneumoniae]|uniref:hypothetical protein n=1 Tax=Klebsiella pneumoniae TaxID=573 RepID=UPI00403AD4CD
MANSFNKSSKAAWLFLLAQKSLKASFANTEKPPVTRRRTAHMSSAFRDTCNVHIDNYYGLHGWGFQGHHGIKGLYGNRNTFNRVDFHSFGHDVFFKDLTRERQAN